MYIATWERGIWSMQAAHLRKQLVLEAQIVTGVGDEPIEMVSVYPVPTDRYLYVKDAALKPVKATLLDVQGRILQLVSFRGDVQFDLEALGQGMYILVLELRDR